MLKKKMLKNYGWTFKTATHGTEVTRLYPEVMIELPAAERGIHELDATTCIGCASCARICPNACIEMVPYKYGNPLKNKKLVLPQIDYGRCMFCGLCVDECPVGSLKMGKKVTITGWDRKDLVRGPDKLAVKKFTEKEAAELAAEAKRIAAEKAAAAAAKKKAGGAKEGEGAAAAKPAAKKVGAENKAAAVKEATPEKAKENAKEGGAS
jgi:formate hydrogenlyase subunit 6/NADH:ubiquinone oxidoreductase subunit I